MGVRADPCEFGGERGEGDAAVQLQDADLGGRLGHQRGQSGSGGWRRERSAGPGTHPLSSLPDDDDERHSFPDNRIPDPCSSSGGSCSTDCPHLWTHPSRALLRPVFRFLEIDDKAWPGLEETATSAVIKHHIGAYLRLIFEDEEESSSERSEQQFGLAKAVDAMVKSLEAASISIGIKEKYHDEEEKAKLGTMPNSKAVENTSASSGLTSSNSLIGLTDQFGQLWHEESAKLKCVVNSVARSSFRRLSHSGDPSSTPGQPSSLTPPLGLSFIYFGEATQDGQRPPRSSRSGLASPPSNLVMNMGAWVMNVVSSVGIIMVNKQLMSPTGYAFVFASVSFWIRGD